MQSKNLSVVLLAIGLGFAAGIAARPYLSDLASSNRAETKTLSFDSNVTSYSNSEKGVIGIKKIDDRTYAIKAVNPGMCVITFSAGDDSDVPLHARLGRFIVFVSPNKSLTIQETKFAAGGML